MNPGGLREKAAAVTAVAFFFLISAALTVNALDDMAVKQAASDTLYFAPLNTALVSSHERACHCTGFKRRRG